MDRPIFVEKSFVISLRGKLKNTLYTLYHWIMRYFKASVGHWKSSLSSFIEKMISYARKATLNLLATDFGDTARFKGAG